MVEGVEEFVGALAFVCAGGGVALDPHPPKIENTSELTKRTTGNKLFFLIRESP
ncbi:hypothetical protein EMIT07CA2_100010 [Brevibacillus sp. IT-7CA2]